MLDTLPTYKELGSRPFAYTFECPEGVWRGRLDAKAWGKGRTILLYFSETGTGKQYCVCVFDATHYAAEDRGINFRLNGRPGQAFELTTAKTRTARTRLLSATIIAATESSDAA
jgi:hypothetical protein